MCCTLLTETLILSFNLSFLIFCFSIAIATQQLSSLVCMSVQIFLSINFLHPFLCQSTLFIPFFVNQPSSSINLFCVNQLDSTLAQLIEAFQTFFLSAFKLVMTHTCGDSQLHFQSSQRVQRLSELLTSNNNNKI